MVNEKNGEGNKTTHPKGRDPKFECAVGGKRVFAGSHLHHSSSK